MQEKMFTIRETSRILGLRERTIREWIHREKLKAVKYTGGRMWHIPESEIQRVTEGR